MRRTTRIVLAVLVPIQRSAGRRPPLEADGAEGCRVQEAERARAPDAGHGERPRPANPTERFLTCRRSARYHRRSRHWHRACSSYIERADRTYPVKIHEYQAKTILARYGVPDSQRRGGVQRGRSRRDRQAPGRHRRRQGADSCRRPRQGRRREAGQERRGGRAHRARHDRHDAQDAPDRTGRPAWCRASSSNRAWASPASCIWR